MEDQTPKANRPAPDKKPAPVVGGNGNSIWYVVAIVALAALLINNLGEGAGVDIKSGKLEELIEQGSPKINPKAELIVDEGTPDKPRKVRYSNLSDLRFGEHQITGTVTREILSPDPEKRGPEKSVPFRTSRIGLTDDNGRLMEILQKKGFTDFGSENPPSGLQAVMPMLVMMAVAVALLVFVMRKFGGPGSAMAFGRSRAKLFAQEEIGISFKDVAGIEEAVQELQEVVDFLKLPEKYQILGGRIPKGVLLVGPPGTGKTLLAKAVAGEAGVPFFSLSGSDFVEMFVGVGAARVRDMFLQAQAKAPCIVFIDELDALGKTRGAGVVGGHDEREQTLNALLVEMDGFSSNNGVIVMAATNRPETLDPALLRPGRFDRHVLVDRPDVLGREKILEVHAKNVKTDETVDLKQVAKITPGFAGADLANLVNEAALLAARSNKLAVSMKEFNEGVERVTAGLEKRQRVMHVEEKQRVAYHESAHALVAFSLPNSDPVHKVSIIPRGLAALGYTMHRPEGDRFLMTQSEIESRIQVLLAGTAGEELVFADVSTGAQNDLERATEFARSMVMDYGMSRLGRVAYRDSRQSAFLAGGEDFGRERGHSEQTCREIDEEIRNIINASLEKVRRLLHSRRPALEALAAKLMEKEVIDAAELKSVIEESPSNGENGK